MCHSLQDEKKLENICDFIWRYEIFFVPLHHHLRLAEQTHRGPATGFLTTGVRDKQIAAPVPSYHRQGLHFEHL